MKKEISFGIICINKDILMYKNRTKTSKGTVILLAIFWIQPVIVITRNMEHVPVGWCVWIATFRISLSLSKLFTTSTEPSWKPEVIQKYLSVISSLVSLRRASGTWQSVATSSFGHDVDEMGNILKFTLNISNGKEWRELERVLLVLETRKHAFHISTGISSLPTKVFRSIFSVSRGQFRVSISNYATTAVVMLISLIVLLLNAIWSHLVSPFLLCKHWLYLLLYYHPYYYY